MSTGFGEGEGRVKQAIDDALNSPLLNDNNVYNAKKILLSINFSNEKNNSTGLMMEEMNEVNDFMEKFGDGFEIKWGMAIDPELGSKVKITILATGFGVEDIEPEERRNRRTLEDAKLQAQREEEDENRRSRRERYYINEGNNGQTKRRPKIYRFSQDDLDNEDVILAVENSPTYKRSSQNLKEIQSQAAGIKSIPDNDAQQEAVPGLISFG